MFPHEAPAPTYPEYQQLLALAQQRRAANPFVDPRCVYQCEEAVQRRGWDWAEAVLGRAWTGLRYISMVDDYLLKVADERDVTPPAPEYLVERRRVAAEHDAARRQRQAESDQRDRDKWRVALGQAPTGVVFEVFTHTVAQVRRGSRHNLGHVVPQTAVYSGVRKVRTHAAGRALCESEQRRPLRLHSSPESADVPGTCMRCVDWVTKVRTQP